MYVTYHIAPKAESNSYRQVTELWDAFADKLTEEKHLRRLSCVAADTTEVKKQKDGYIFVGGALRGTRRARGEVVNRSMLTLDADNGDEFLWLRFTTLYPDLAAVMYQTVSWSEDKQKLRIVAPFSEPVSAIMYEAIARKFVIELGEHYFDKTTIQPERGMYMPTLPKDVPHLPERQDGAPLDVAAWVRDNPWWVDTKQWLKFKSEKEVHVTEGNKLPDPREKDGIVGRFCRACGDIHGAITKYLPDKYIRFNDRQYSWAHGTALSGGLLLYDNAQYAYSLHATDPISCRECNAWDLVRIHMFGEMDKDAAPDTPIGDMPSQKAMEAWASALPEMQEKTTAEAAGVFDADETDNTDNLDNIDDDPDAWLKKLVKGKNGLVDVRDNYVLILQNGAFKDVLAFDEFKHRISIRKNLPWRKMDDTHHKEYEAWQGFDDREAMVWLESNFRLSSSVRFVDALTHVARRNPFHPIKEYIESAPWDGVERLETLFVEYLGAEASEINRMFTRKQFIAGVKRIYEPGCKHDYVLILVGAQGGFKSSLLARMGGEWFNDSLKNFDSKEAGEMLQSAWLFEFGEMSAYKKSEIEDVKQFITKTTDSYRVAYDREVSDFPRKAIFFGTTNEEEFLRDKTGNRRFWCIRINPKKRTKNLFKELTDKLVQQYWAEAYYYYKQGEDALIPEHMISQVEESQAQFEETDATIGVIEAWLEGDTDSIEEIPDRICAATVWCECLHKNLSDLKHNAKDITRVLRKQKDWIYVGKKRVPNYGVQHHVFDRKGGKYCVEVSNSR